MSHKRKKTKFTKRQKWNEKLAHTNITPINFFANLNLQIIKYVEFTPQYHPQTVALHMSSLQKIQKKYFQLQN